MAAALASALIVLRDNKDYTHKLVHKAETLFKFSRDQRGRYSKGPKGVDASIFFNSSGYYDEFVLAGAWTYYAIGNDSYLTLATNIEITKLAGAFQDFPVLVYLVGITSFRELKLSSEQF